MNLRALLGLAGLMALVMATPASAQAPELVLSLSRDFGYGGFGNEIEGLFSLHATGPDDLARVDFYLDDRLMVSVSAPPFEVQFSTSTYASGEHRMSARGFTSGGVELRSNELVRIFLTKDETGQQVVGLVVPLLAGIAAVVVIMALITVFFGRKAGFKGSYGALGGTVCANCGLPFSLSFFALRLMVARLQRCPHCGSWALVRRAQPKDLAAAEARWRGDQPAAASGEYKARRARHQIDDSRYEN